MLLELSVARIALIESLHLQFDKGLHVFTGETGAGKSILLDSIGLLLGNRWSSDMLRAGSDDAYIEALFTYHKNTVEIPELLRTWGIDDGTDEVLISRHMYRNGRTVCRINGRIATVQMLRELGMRLVQQHGQHDNQGLLRPEEQMRLLDLYGRHGDLLRDVGQAYRAWTAAKTAWREAHLDEQERVRRLDMLSFQIEEIEAASLTVGEDELLRAERQRLQHADKIAHASQSAVQLLGGGAGASGVLELMAMVNGEIAAALNYDERLQDVSGLLENAEVYVQEALRGLQTHLHEIEADPARLEEVENRLVEIRTLTRKYGPNLEDVIAHLEQAKSERSALERHEEQLQLLEVELQRSEERLHHCCQKLHEQRVKAAKKLANEVEAVLRQLNMPNARLEIAVTERSSGELENTYASTGYDTVQFLFSANKGEEVKPLQKIASGGELSRTLLAIKAVLAAVDDMDTLIFDEIDAGVSGTSAQKIAEQLLRLGTLRQVLCVTHSAQIAAAGHHHFVIEKVENHEHTSTHVRPLNKVGRTREIARLVGSDVADDTALRHADALLESFRTNGKSLG